MRRIITASSIFDADGSPEEEGEEGEEDAGILFGMDEDQSIPSSKQPTREKNGSNEE